MPKLPNSEKGASELKFLSEHRGNKTVSVILSSTRGLAKYTPVAAPSSP